ncbi:hypothetical protein KBC79_04440 [Candidatus Woesebacteria bacterium]|nr:hypothetical protein [Candidatus Woesebacteria bacterium]
MVSGIVRKYNVGFILRYAAAMLVALSIGTYFVGTAKEHDAGFLAFTCYIEMAIFVFGGYMYEKYKGDPDMRGSVTRFFGLSYLSLYFFVVLYIMSVIYW